MGRFRVALTLLVIGIAAGGGWWTAVGVVRRADRPSVNAHLAELDAQARVAAAGVAAWFTRTDMELASASAAVGAWQGTPAQIAAARAPLDAAAAASPNLDGGLVVADRKSLIVATTTALAPLQGQRRESPATTNALAGTASTAGDVAEDPLTHVISIPRGVPLHDARGSVTGVLIGFTRVPGGSLAAVVSATETALGHPVSVVTAGGTVVSGATSPPSGISRVDDSLAAAVRAAPRGAGHLRYAGEAHVATVAAFAPLPDGWALVTPRPAVTLAVTGERATQAAGVAVAILLGVSVTVVLALVLLLQARTSNVEEVKQSFLAIAGHELRTPLTVMKGFTDLLVDRWDDVPDESRLSIVETIDYQVRNLEHLVERLLLGAQLEAGVAPSISHEAVLLAPPLEAIARHQRAIAPTHEFVVDVPEGLSVWADAKGLEHVITNLVENAVKYSPDGGVVTTRAELARDRVLLTIEDEGIGLPADLDAIFEKFVQREAVDTRVHDEGGVGLGLYIVRTLVERMGGSVRAERRSPKGAKFVVTLRASS